MSQLQSQSDSLTYQPTPLELAIKAQDRRQVRILIRQGTNVNHINRRGLSPLHIAVELKDTFIVNLLVRNGANLEARTVFFETPLLVAADIQGNIDMVYYLLRLGANILARDDEGNSIHSYLSEEEILFCEDICYDIKNSTHPIPASLHGPSSTS